MRRSRIRLLDSIWVFVALPIGLWVLSFAICVALGKFDDWREASQYAIVMKQSHDPLNAKLREILAEMLSCIPNILAVSGATLGVAICLPNKRNRPVLAWVVFAVVAAPLLVYVLVTKSPPFNSRFHVQFCVFSAALAFLSVSAGMGTFLHGQRSRGLDKNRFLLRCFTAMVIAYASVKGLCSGNGFLNALYGTDALFVLGVVGLGRVARAYHASWPRSPAWYASGVASLAVSCLAYGALNLANNFKNVYRDRRPEYLTAQFAIPPLRGIRSTPERVQAIEGIVKKLTTLVQRGECILIYDHCPMLYFLTHTRPALNITWTGSSWPTELQKRFVRYMRDHGRVPRYAVRCLIRPRSIGYPKEKRIPYHKNGKKIPIHAFVSAHYRKTQKIGPFEIWRRAEEMPDNPP